ncbi:MAG: transporter, SSS domain protein [Myxococcales bacterium]|nr:transporter, SSS domain protein [Myxococcales bacterium]
MLAALAIAYVLAMFAMSLVAQRRIRDVEDFVVAGRRLPLWMAGPTVLATWYGAGVLLTAADEVHRVGLSASLLDPIGAGMCLLIAGVVYARPLWRLKLTTLPDLFRLRYGATAEVLAGLFMVPTYFGWIAAQFMALGTVLQATFSIPLESAVLLVALVGTGYTLIGGMWSVTVTDVLQMTLVALGLSILMGAVFHHVGGAPSRLGSGR